MKSTCLSEMIVSQIDDLLRGARTFDRRIREGEHRVTSFEILNVRPGLLDQLWRIVRADIRVAECFWKPADSFEVQLNASSNHQIVVV